MAAAMVIRLKEGEDMEARKCTHCGQEISEWVEFCPNCSEPVEGYARPAGFWIRLGAYIIDILVFIPLGILSWWNTVSLKSAALIVLVSMPQLVYKPLMESFCGATLGKMACGLRVIDGRGNRLSVPRAYVRFFLFLLWAGVGLATGLVGFSAPELQPGATRAEAAEAVPLPLVFLGAVSFIVMGFVLIDCVVAGFTPRKRALHDMLAGSFCVYKEP
jgi:uncharacterized RDD family membrane protein YckC